LNGAVAEFAFGSRFKGSVREDSNGTVDSGEAGSGDGELARTRSRAASSRSGSAGKPAKQKGFNAEAQRAQRSPGSSARGLAARSEDFGATHGFTLRHRAKRMNSCFAILRLGVESLLACN
jgi:hypothetical protein